MSARKSRSGVGTGAATSRLAGADNHDATPAGRQSSRDTPPVTEHDLAELRLAFELTDPPDLDDGYRADGWAHEVIGNLRRRKPGPVPAYGSADWQALGDDDPHKLAAPLIAAECWRDHCSPARVAADLRAQLAAEDREVFWRIRSASNDVAAARDWRAEASRPSFAELQRRRAEVTVPQRRPA